MQTPIQLTSEELAILHRGEPLRLQANNADQVVLVLAEQYERLKQFVEFADSEPESLYPAIADIFPDDWQDISAFPNAEKL